MHDRVRGDVEKVIGCLVHMLRYLLQWTMKKRRSVLVKKNQRVAILPVLIASLAPHALCRKAMYLVFLDTDPEKGGSPIDSCWAQGRLGREDIR